MLKKLYNNETKCKDCPVKIIIHDNGTISIAESGSILRCCRAKKQLDALKELKDSGKIKITKKRCVDKTPK